MEGSGEVAGCGAKRKREASPDADLCCDSRHEVRCLRPCWWRSRSPQGIHAGLLRTFMCAPACNLPPVACRSAQESYCGRRLPGNALRVGVSAAAWWRVLRSWRLSGLCNSIATEAEGRDCAGAAGPGDAAVQRQQL